MGAKWLPIGLPRPSSTPSMKALRSIACISARRTRTSSNGFFLLLIVMMPLPAVSPISTVKRLSAWNCFRLCGAPKRGMPSMSPASSAATCAAGSLMKRKVTLLDLDRARRRGSRPTCVSVIDAALLPARRSCRGRCRPAWWRWSAALFGSQDHGRVLAQAEQEVVPSALFSTRITVCGSGAAMLADVVEHRLLGLVGATLGLGALEAELHRRGVEGLAVLELHALASA